MQFELPVAAPASPLMTLSPTPSRSSSLAGRPRRPSPLRRSSTPEDAERLHNTSIGDSSKEGGDEVEEATISRGETSTADLGRRASEGSAITSTSHEGSSFTQTSLSKSTSALTEATSNMPPTSLRKLASQANRPNSSSDFVPLITSHHSVSKTIGNGHYTLPPIRTTPKFPHSSSLRPLRPLSSVSGGNNGVPSLNSVPHAGAGTAGRTPQRQKIIVPTKSWKACFDLNLTQKELARFD